MFTPVSMRSANAYKTIGVETSVSGASPHQLVSLLFDALQQAADWQARRQRLHPIERQRLLIITDGRLRDWPALTPSACPALLVDIESAPIRLGRARQLADELGTDYRHIDSLPVVAGSLETAL